MTWLTFKPRRALPLGFLGMLALVWAMESFINRHDLWFSTVDADTWKGARVATEHLKTGGVFLFGDSQVEYGISPVTVQSHLGQPVRNLAIRRGQAPSSYFLLRRVLRSGVVPSAIVINFEAHLMRDGRGASDRLWPELIDLEECLDLVRTFHDPAAFGPLALAHFVPSVRDRVDIRATLMTSLQGKLHWMPDFMRNVRRNHGVNRGALLYAKRPVRQLDFTLWTNSQAIPWTPNATNDIYVHRLLELAQEHKIPVFCAIMPFQPDLERTLAEVGTKQAYNEWIAGLMRAHPGLTILDWRHSSYPDSVFVDACHLDVEGAAAIGISLAEFLGRSFRGEAGHERWVQMPNFRLDGSQVALEDHFRSYAAIQAADQRRR